MTHLVANNPHLRIRLLTTAWPTPLSGLSALPQLQRLMRLAPEPPPLERADDALRAAVRDLLRFHGFKPTGRSKPSSEYLLRAATETPDRALPAINVAVDLGNALSLQSGLPLSVIDLDRATPPFSVGPGAEGASYVFNRSGQTIDVSGLLCLHDEGGPCANPVKDAQRTKTDGDTRRTLTVVWGLQGAAGAARTDAVARLWVELATAHGARCAPDEAPSFPG